MTERSIRLWRFACAVLLCCACFVAWPAIPASAAWQPMLAVGLLKGQTEVSLSVRQGTANLFADGKAAGSVPDGTTLRISLRTDSFLVNGRKIPGSTFVVKPGDKAVLAVNGKLYRGSLRLLRRGSTIQVINDVQTEDYLRGVLPSEMPPEWPLEAKKAQAVAARTFALANRGRHKSEGYDLCTTTHCQSYSGIQGERDASTAAIDATFGQVAMYQGRLIDAVFHTDSGGMTENSEDVWGAKIPYLRAASEARRATQPWQKEWALSVFSAKLHAKSDVGTLKRIQLSPLQIGKATIDRSVSGRVKTVALVGDRGALRLSGNEMRNLFGLKSTLFDLRISGNRVIATGYGYGHGLGLSQWGAKAYAEKGASAKDILVHYYRDIQIKDLYKK